MKFSVEKTVDVVGLGNALMDVLIEVDEDVLASTELAKGGMHLVDADKARQLLKNLNNAKPKASPGGVVANTIKGVAILGGRTVLFAKVGKDKYGDDYIESIKLHGVATRIGRDISTTGHALTFITPDAERTFSVHLGAALTLGKGDIIEEDIATAKVLHLEAFQFEGPTKDTVFHAIDIAKKNDTKISIDLADSFLIKRNFDLFKEVVTKHVDILFCNEEEGKVFTGKDGVDALSGMADMAETAILKLGESGSMIAHCGEVIKIEPVMTKAVDTTGAGDIFAAGFLFGYTNGWDIKRAGNLGSHFASLVIEKVGVNVLEVDVKKFLKH